VTRADLRHRIECRLKEIWTDDKFAPTAEEVEGLTDLIIEECKPKLYSATPRKVTKRKKGK